MNIAIFGGSFDPPHIAHIEIVKRALQKLDIDLLIIVPTYLNPFKKTFQAPPQKRVQWLKKIFLTHKKVKICDYEVKREKVTYAIETVKYIKKRFQPKKIYYIIGSDNVVTLHKWKNYKKLKKEVEFVIADRKGYGSIHHFKKLTLQIDISSTQLRKKPIKRFLPKIVAEELLKFYQKRGVSK